MKRVAVLSQLVLSTLAAAVLAGRAVAEPSVFNCISVGSENRCTADPRLVVEILDSGDGKAAFVVVNDGPAGIAVDQVYVQDAGGTLVGPPQILNRAPDVMFEWTGKQKQFSGAAGIRPAFKVDPDLGAVAAHPSGLLGMNSGESLGLVYAIAGGLTLADVIRDFGAGKLRFAMRSVDCSGSAGGSVITQASASEAFD